MAQFDLKNAVIKIKDGGTEELEVIVGDGNLTYDEKKAREYVMNRGKIYTVRDGDEEPLEVSLDILWEFLKASSGEPPTIEDALKNRGEASTWVSTSTDPCEPYCVDIEITYSPNCTGVENEVILLKYFRYENLNHDLKAGTVSTSGKCNVVEATVTRS